MIPLSVHYAAFADAVVREARGATDVHRLGRHLTKWLSETGRCKRLPPGRPAPDNNRYLAQFWNGAEEETRAAIRAEARRHLNHLTIVS